MDLMFLSSSSLHVSRCSKRIPAFHDPTRRSRHIKTRANPENDHKTNIPIDSDEDRIQKNAEARFSYLNRTHTLTLLKQQMRVAIQNQDFKEAARIRDALKNLEDEEPALRLKNLLKKAISEERYKDAAKYKKDLQLIAPQALLTCYSEETTLGVRVQVRSVYVEKRSQPLKGQYFFAYRIKISNVGDRTVQLLRRHWAITDGTGKTEHVWGAGVIGEQPILLPDATFEYTSACPLRTETGMMEGEFEMKYVDEVDTDCFNVIIAPFALSFENKEEFV